MSNGKVHLKNVVAKQLPEHIRESYPTFVAFVEAYYEYLQTNSVDLSKIRDIDTTLESFLQYFKKELAHNLPANIANERFLLNHIKDQYLAKGSEASYRLLFRLLYGKEIYMEYPGKSMLRVSDGRWKQDVSVIVRVDAGDPAFIVGKIVDVQTSKNIYRSALDISTQRLTKVTVNVESFVVVDEAAGIYEIFLDRNFYGEISAGDVIKLGSDFQALVLPVTSQLKIQNGGQGFKPGMVFQVSTGNGKPIWFKVTSVRDEGENETLVKGILKTIDIIKFGRNYDTDFSITITPSSAVRTSKKVEQEQSTITYSKVEGNIGAITLLTGGANYTMVPTVAIGGNGSGATAHAVLGTGDQEGQVVEIVMDTLGQDYTTAFVNIIRDPLDLLADGATAEPIIGQTVSYVTSDKTDGLNELGYINYSDYWEQNISGSGATASCEVGDGLIRKITITDGGTNYYQPPTVTIDGDGTGATAYAVLGNTPETDGQVVQIVVDNFGEGYTLAETSVIITRAVGDEPGEEATATPVVVNGGIKSIKLTAGGSGYVYRLPSLHINQPQTSLGVPITNTAQAKAWAVTISEWQPDTIYRNGDVVWYEDRMYRVVNFGRTDDTNPPTHESGEAFNGIAWLAYIGARISWESSLDLETDDVVWYEDRMYRVVQSGTTGLTGPTHTIGVVANGTTTLAYISDSSTNGIGAIKLTDCGYGYTSQPAIKITGQVGWADGAYVGEIARQFYLDAKDTTTENPAIINVTLGALAKYPGYYKTNDGFISDAMFVQDSYYYQSFSYVIRIDEQLQSYASVVRSMLHPSGMALFGEYSINNNIDLSVALEILIRSLGVGFSDKVVMEDSTTFFVGLGVVDSVTNTVGFVDVISEIITSKPLQTSLNTQNDELTHLFTKAVTDVYTFADPLADSIITSKVFGKLATDSPIVTESMIRDFSKALAESYSGSVDSAAITTTKPFEDSQSLDDATVHRLTKVVTGANNIDILETVTQYLTKSLQDVYQGTSITESVTRVFDKTREDAVTPVASVPTKTTTKYVTDTSIGTFTHAGYIVFDPYEEGGYFLELYANAYASTF